jgi:hypothetical protein
MLTTEPFCHFETHAETVVSFLSSRSSEATYRSRNASRVPAVDVAVDGVGDVVVEDVQPATITAPSTTAAIIAAAYRVFIFDRSFRCYPYGCVKKKGKRSPSLLIK